MNRETSDGPRWYFGIFLALVGAAAVVSTTDLVGEAAAMARLFAVVFAAFGFFSLLGAFRGSPKTVAARTNMRAPSCDVAERPARQTTKFPA